VSPRPRRSSCRADGRRGSPRTPTRLPRSKAGPSSAVSAASDLRSAALMGCAQTSRDVTRLDCGEAGGRRVEAEKLCSGRLRAESAYAAVRPAPKEGSAARLCTVLAGLTHGTRGSDRFGVGSCVSVCRGAIRLGDGIVLMSA
jgi:hypothetical protein